MAAPAAHAPDSKVPLPTIWAFGTMAMPVAGMGLLYGVYLPRHYVGLGIGFVAVAFAITVVRFVDVFFDPLVALVMDRTKTPIGRYRPWLVLGTPIVMLGIYMAMMPRGPVEPALPDRLADRQLRRPLDADARAGRMVCRASPPATTTGRALYAWTSLMGVLAVDAILLLPALTHGKVAAGLKSSFPVIGLILLITFPIALVHLHGVHAGADHRPGRSARSSSSPTTAGPSPGRR